MKARYARAKSDVSIQRAWAAASAVIAAPTSMFHSSCRLFFVTACAKLGPAASVCASVVALANTRSVREAVVEPPPFRLNPVHEPPGVEQLARAALPDDPRQHCAGPHVGARKADATNRKPTGSSRAEAKSLAMARIAPAPAQMPSMAATIGCGHARMFMTRYSGEIA